MDEAAIEGIREWLIDRGLAGDSEIELLQGFCDRCLKAGLVMTRGLVIIDTLHPIYEGRVFFWERDKEPENSVSHYESSTEGDGAAAWRKSPFYALLYSGETEMRRRLAEGETDYEMLEELRLKG